MTFRIVAVTTFEEPEQGHYGKIMSKAVVVRSDILTRGYAQAVANRLNSGVEYDEMVHYEVRDGQGYKLLPPPAPIDDEIPF